MQEQYKQQQEQEESCYMARESREDKFRNMVSSNEFYYSDVSSNNPNIQTHLVNHMQSFESNPELFNLTTSKEMLGSSSKNLQHKDIGNSVVWKEFFGKSGNQGSCSSKSINETTIDFYQPEFNKTDFSAGFSETTSENLMVAPDSAWQENRLLVDDSSLRCVFPCEGSERPSQGLSLSLCSKKPSNIGLQSFELRETSHHHQHQQQDDIKFVSSNSRDGIFGKSGNLQQQQEQHILQDGYFGKTSNLHQTHFQLKNSKYLAPAQELLNEFCNLGTKQNDPPKQKHQKTNQWEGENGSCSSGKQSPYALDLLELQKRKAKLLSMLEEVDRRYRHYCNQMKAVVSSFEAVAGNNAATVYSALASKAMSRHFRCLRDGIVGQIQATKKAMGEKDDPVAPGTAKGETPRLKLLDQTLRNQRAFQQMSMIETHPWRPQRGLPERSVSVLRAWLFEHFLHPLWKPMVEEMYLEETKEQDNIASSDVVTGLDDNGRPNQNHSPNQDPQSHSNDQKPSPEQLVRIDSECLSSIINHPEKNDTKNIRNHQNYYYHHHQQQQSQQHQQQFGGVAEMLGVIDLDFSTYNHQIPSTLSYTNGGVHQNFGSNVSLTLGLQQHGGSGVSLAFSPPSQHSLFPRDHIEDCQPVHEYSILDGDQVQNLPYRNLMGAQLLHDLAG
ncbi:hypothetical protein HHK36_027667 [Tetracentron sinense]|uniref:POX domain-containing protein n=1 Tax=Tetracentron sinense TaxID=13715 RepID=A0A835D1R8_TETSI|nr:hypothetical protein HHK36_027667 [Tetracentron sinense]